MKIFFLMGLLLATNAYPQTTDELKPVYKQFTQGYYADTLIEIDQLKTKYPNSGVLFYTEALSYKKMQEFQDAYEYFLKAEKVGFETEEFWYEKGQTLYALKKNRPAIGAFVQSIKKSFKVEQSQLYIAEILDEMGYDKKAYKFYDKVSKSRDLKIAQAGNFKKANLLNKKARKLRNKDKVILNKILPKLEEALRMDPNSPISQEISFEIYRIKNKYGMLPKKLRNGNFIPAQSWDFELTQRTSYNSNVIQEADDVVNEAANKGSLVSYSELFMAKRFNFNDFWILEPTFRAANTYNLDRDTAEIYQNDLRIFTPEIRNRFEHLLFGKAATTIFEIAFDHARQDFNAVKKLEHYTDTLSFTLGERFRLFDAGLTTVKYRREIVTGADENDSLDRITNVFSIRQTINLRSGGFVLLFNENRLNAFDNAPSSDFNRYLFRIDYVKPKAFGEWEANANFGLTLVDPKEQKDTRGIEKLLAPGGYLSRNFLNNNLEFRASYNFNKNLSKDKATYQYTQHLLQTDLIYSF